MKILQKFVNNSLGNDFKITVLTFTHAATGTKNKRKGYSITGPAASGIGTVEYFVFEPCSYSNGDKWLIYGSYFHRYATAAYAVNLHKAVSLIKKICNYK